MRANSAKFEIANDQTAMDPAMDLILNWRNEVAVECIDMHMQVSDNSYAYVHYGEAHISGMVKLLEDYGWRVTNHQQKDLRPYIWTK